MRTRYRISVVLFFAAFVLSGRFTTAARDDSSEKSVKQLIDDLTEIKSQSIGIDGAAIYEGFIADTIPASFEMGVLGVPAPEVPLPMRELVRRGPPALPELIAHLDDARSTKLQVGNDDSANSSRRVGVDSFAYSYFSDEYEPRVLSGSRTEAMEKEFQGRYTVKVGDVCYVLIGQIVNRRLRAVRYQPSAILVVNSPIEAPKLAAKVRSDWGNVDAEALKASLLSDIREANHPRGMKRDTYAKLFVNPALRRLRLYFPDTYDALKGADLAARKQFEAQGGK
jgi:hypothetical protein